MGRWWRRDRKVRQRLVQIILQASEGCKWSKALNVIVEVDIRVAYTMSTASTRNYFLAVLVYKVLVSRFSSRMSDYYSPTVGA